MSHSALIGRRAAEGLHFWLAHIEHERRAAAQLRQLHRDLARRGALESTTNALLHDARAIRTQIASAQRQVLQHLEQLFTADLVGAAA